MYFFLKLCLNRFASEFHSLLGPYSLYIVCKFQANLFRQSFKKIHFHGHFIWCRGPDHGRWRCHLLSSWWVPSLIFKFWITCIRIYVLPTLNLMLGLNSAANFTPRIIFSSHNMNDFTMYTYNKKAPMMGLDISPMMALSGPVAPMTATPWQPHSLTTLTWSTFNLISINYDDLWFHTLNVLEGWMWIGKKFTQYYYLSLVMV